MSSSELEKALGSSVQIPELPLLQRLQSQFRSWEPSEFIAFVTTNSDLIPNFIPVSLPKKVPIVPRGTKLDDCRITLTSLTTLANNLGRPGIYEGIGVAGSLPITAHGVALRARMRGTFRTVHVDIDADVFGDGTNPGEVDQRLLDWVNEVEPAALKVRGNRQRLSLFIGITDELQDYFLDTFDETYTPDGRVEKKATSKIQYRLKSPEGEAALDGRVEIVFGANNNTVFGYHPSAGMYQQIAPEGNDLGALDLEDFQQLIEILDEISYEAHYNNGTTGDRITLLDGWEDLEPLIDIIKWKNTIDSSFALPSERQGVKLSIRDYITDKTQQVIDGQLFRDDRHYYDADPASEFSIQEGYRHSTYRHVGQDIEQIKAIFDEVGIKYDDDEIAGIFETLWDHTDTTGGGSTGSDYTLSEAEGSFYGACWPTYKKMYFTSLCAAIYGDIVLQIENLIEQIGSSDDDDKPSPISKQLSGTVAKGKETLETSIKEQIEEESKKTSAKLKEAIHSPVTGNSPLDNPYDVGASAIAAKAPATEKPASILEGDTASFVNELLEGSTTPKEAARVSNNPFQALIAAGMARPLAGALELDEMPSGYIADGSKDDDDELDEIQKKLQSYRKKADSFTSSNGGSFSVVSLTDDPTLDLVAEINKQETDLQELVFADNEEIIPECIRDHVKNSLGHKLVGYTFPFMVHASILLVACAKNFSVINLDASDKKYKTILTPYGLTVTKSGQGKTLVSDLVSPLGNLMNSHFSMVSGREVIAFKNAYVSNNSLMDTEKLQNKLDNDEGEDSFDNDNLAERVEELTALEQILREKKPSDILNSGVARVLGNSTEAGLRMVFATQQMKKDIRRATKGKFFNDAYSYPVAIYNDEIGALITDLFSGSKSGFAGDTQMYCGLKEGHMTATARVTTGLTISDTTAISLGGNMTTKKFLEVLQKELQGTDGFFPRINLSAMQQKAVGEIDPNRSQEWEHDYDSSDFVTYSMIGAGLVSHFISAQIYKGGCEDHPLHVSEIRLSTEAQKVMYGAMNRAEREKKRIQGKFYNHTDFIESTLNKQPKEMAIYAGSIWLLDNALEYFSRLQSAIAAGIKSEVPTVSIKEMLALALSGEHHERQRFIDLIKTAMVYYGPDLEATSVAFDRQISEGIMQRAEAMFFRSVHTFEFFLHQIEKTNANDITARAKEARNKGILRNFNPAGYDTESQLNLFAESLIKRVGKTGTKKVMTLAQIGTQSTRAMRTLYDSDKGRIEDIAKVLYRGGVLIDFDAESKANSTTFRLNPDIAIAEIKERVGAIAKAVADGAVQVMTPSEK